MLVIKSRYTADQMRNLGYTPEANAYGSYHYSPDARRQKDDLFKGQFKHIIDLIYDSTDGRLNSDPTKLITESAPEAVRQFARNVLLADIPALKAAPDADTAMEMIIPRSVSTVREFQPYADNIRNYIQQRIDSAKQSQPSD